RLGLCHPDAAQGDELVKRNMAVCFFISRERTNMIAKYTSEPLLGQAACMVLQKTFTATLSHILASFRRMDLVSPSGGTIGELVAAVIFLRSYDTAKLAVARAADVEEASDTKAAKVAEVNMETE